MDHPEQAPTPAADVPLLSRRLLLSAGGILLLSACAPGSEPAAPTAGTTAGRTASRSPAASPAPTTSAPAPGPSVAGDLGGGNAAQDAVTTVPGSGKVLALTIDDGPTPEYTPKVLAVLKKYDVKASFCMIGLQVKQFPHTTAMVHDAGHEIVNHTWHHYPMRHMTTSHARAALGRVNDALDKVIPGYAPTWFRAPSGSWGRNSVTVAASLGMKPLGWAVDPMDWAKPGTSHIVDTIMTGTRPGSVVLAHDGGGNRTQTVEALSIVIPRLLAQGYTFVQP